MMWTVSRRRTLCPNMPTVNHSHVQQTDVFAMAYITSEVRGDKYIRYDLKYNGKCCLSSSFSRSLELCQKLLRASLLMWSPSLILSHKIRLLI
jgi:hypothetical protein